MKTDLIFAPLSYINLPLMRQDQLTFPINSFERFHCVWETGLQDDDGMLPEEVHHENIH